jgi:hypothetical protein
LPFSSIPKAYHKQVDTGGKRTWKKLRCNNNNNTNTDNENDNDNDKNKNKKKKNTDKHATKKCVVRWLQAAV